MKWSSDRERWMSDHELCANDYNIGLCFRFGDWDLGLWKEVWIKGKRMGICFGIGCGEVVWDDCLYKRKGVLGCGAGFGRRAVWNFDIGGKEMWTSEGFGEGVEVGSWGSLGCRDWGSWGGFG